MTGRSSLRKVLCLALEVGRKFCSNGVFVFTFQLESLMKRSFVKIYCGVIAVAIIAMAATTASAAGGLLLNGDAELESRFIPHGTPGVDTPFGLPDSWHHSAPGAGWNPTGDGMVTSGIHSLYLEDASLTDHEELRSFVEDPATGYGLTSGVIPDVGLEGRSLWVMYKWKWLKGDGDLFGATLRTSNAPADGNLDLTPPDAGVRGHLFLTDGSADSNGFQMYMASIPLLATEATFDITFRTRDDTAPASEMGRLWIDDVMIIYHVPEPATMGLLGLAGLGLMMVSRRRRS